MPPAVEKPGPPPRRWVWYLLPAVLGLLPTLGAPGHMVGDGVDAYGTGWFFWWIRMCVTHLGNPGWTTLFFSPEGKDIFAHTGNNFVDAVFAVPFQLAFGLNWSAPFTLLLLAGNAWSFEQLARELWEDPRDVFAATMAWMVNPYVIFEVTAGRPTQAMMWWFPLAILELHRICRGDASFRTATALGVATALTGWTYWFSAYFLVFLMVPLALWWGVGSWRTTVRGLLVAVGVCAVLVAPMALGMREAWNQGLVPGVTANGPEAANVSRDLHGVWLMETRGAPLLLQPAWLLGALLGVWKGRRNGWAWLGITLMLVAIGFGARMGGARIVNPIWSVVSHLPFLSRLWFPYRITMVAMLPMTVLVIHAWRGFGRSRVLGLAFLVVALGGEAFSGTFPFNHVDATCPPILLDAAKEPGTFMFLPGGIQSDVLLWQTQFQRPTFGGMGESAPAFWPKGYAAHRHDPWIRALEDATASPFRTKPGTPGDAEALNALGVRWIVLRRDLITALWRNERQHGGKPTREIRDAEAIRRLSLLLGPPAGADDRLVIWDLTGSWGNPNFSPCPERLLHPPPDNEVRPGFELGMVRMGRSP